VSEDGVAQRSIWQTRDHCNLDARHDLAGADTEGSEANDAIAIGLHQGL
jgi:hypothetical protein